MRAWWPLLWLLPTIAAMISIRSEIATIERGEVAVEDSALRHAPHPAADILGAEWDRPYPREVAAYPGGTVAATKYWPPVSRIDGAHGDRNVVCSCPPLSAYSD